MGAFNFITFTHVCPACGNESLFSAQTHIASSYDGDDAGRFHDFTYAMGQKMRWWASTDKEYSEWKDGNYKHPHLLADDADMECCYLDCELCKADLFAVIQFENCTPTRLVEMGMEDDWPTDFFK